MTKVKLSFLPKVIILERYSKSDALAIITINFLAPRMSMVMMAKLSLFGQVKSDNLATVTIA